MLFSSLRMPEVCCPIWCGGLSYAGQFCVERPEVWWRVLWGGLAYMVSSLVGEALRIWCQVLWGGLGYGVPFGGEA